MNVNRSWVTPVTMGAFGLMAATGVMMFFGIRPGLTGVAHEWLSWLFLAGVAGHVTANLVAFKRHLASRRTLGIVAAFAVVLAVTSGFFLVVERKPPPEPGWATPVRALSSAPLPVLAQVGGVDTAEMRARLAAAGVSANVSDETTVADLAGQDYEQQKNLLRKVLRAQ